MKTETFNSQRVQCNLAALAEFKKENPDREILKQYSGWGGLRDAVFTPEVYREMKRHVSNETIASIKKSMTNAYYTPKPLIRFIYDALAKLNKPFKWILEPSAGHGVFFELMPEAFKKNANRNLFAVEMDDISSQMLGYLYPDICVFQGRFEKWDTANDMFDLIIGNPPYGREILQDAQHMDLSHLRIHHYFVAKCMRLLKKGGVLAMVLPRYFLDNRRDHARDIIYKEGGSLLAAYRLPDNLFADAKVTVDIVFLTKEKGDDTWLHLDKKMIDGKSVVMNRYFTENPSHVIGDLAVIEAYGRPELTCREYPEKDTIKWLIKHLDSFPATKLPTIDAYKLQLANRLDAVEIQIKALSVLRTQLWHAQCDLQHKERKLVQQYIQTLPVECHM